VDSERVGALPGERRAQGPPRPHALATDETRPGVRAARRTVRTSTGVPAAHTL
jgi:hypothetical protein